MFTRLHTYLLVGNIYLSTSFLFTYQNMFYLLTYHLFIYITFIYVITYLLTYLHTIYLHNIYISSYSFIYLHTYIYLHTNILTYGKIEVQMLFYTLTKKMIEIKNMLNAGIIMFYKVVWWFDEWHWCEGKKPRFDPFY